MSLDALRKAEETQLKNIETNSGKKLNEWTVIIRNCPLTQHGELANALKTEYGLGHGNANMEVHYNKKSNSGVELDELKKIHNQEIHQIKSFGTTVEILPKKISVSLRRKKQFALLQPSIKTMVEIGLGI